MKYIYKYIFLSIFLLTSCSASGQPGASVSSPSPPPVPTETVYEPYTPPRDVNTRETASVPDPDAGTLHLSMRPPVTLNPLLNTDPTVDAILKLIYEPLTVLDETLKPAGNLAAYRFSSDYESVNLTIRSDAIWSDGTPVTSADVIHSIETIRQAPEESLYKRFAQNIALCEEISNKLVKITFTEVYGGSPYMLAFPLIPAHVDADGGIIGNGLYMLESVEAHDRLTLVKSPYTFREQAKIEKIEALFLPDRQTEMHAFAQGIIDAVSMEISEWMKHHSVKEVRYGEYPAMYFDFVGFNHASPVTGQLVFREAAARAFDMDEAVEEIYLDHALRAVSPVNPASWTAFEPAIFEYDISEARRLFIEARQSAFTNHGPAALSGIAGGIRILVNEENDERVKIAGRLSAALTEAGMPARAEVLPFEEFTQKLSEGDFEIFIGSFNLPTVPDLHALFHSESGNFLNYADPRLDALLNAAASAFSEEEYRRALAELQEFFTEEHPVMGLAFRKAAVITDSRVKGELKPSLDNVFANINEWILGG